MRPVRQNRSFGGRQRRARVAQAEGERVDTQTRGGLVPAMQRSKPAVLASRLLSPLTDVVWQFRSYALYRRTRTLRQDWIVVRFPTRKKKQFFCYCPSRVWRWTTAPTKAQRFRSKEHAERATRQCSLWWEDQYRITKL